MIEPFSIVTTRFTIGATLPILINVTSEDDSPPASATNVKFPDFCAGVNLLYKPFIYRASKLSTFGLKTTFWISDGKFMHSKAES